MRSNYRRIGDLVKQIKLKNKENEYDQLLGINIDKFFMPSVANIVGTDLSKYKVVSKNQFACNRMHVGRDERIPISLSESDKPFLVSPAYTVFEIVDSDVLPEYMMMWFRRPEFDRECWFHTDADVRGGLPWELFCDIELPIPSIEKQREIVAEYNMVVNRIKLNEQLNQKLEETAQALYKHWFVDFEFPNEDGKPYKSSGGKMVFNAELEREIPEGWELLPLQDVCSRITDGSHTSPPSVSVGFPMASVKDMKDFKLDLDSCRKISKEDYVDLVKNDCKPQVGDILIAKDGSYLKYIFPIQQEEEVVILSSIAIIRPNDLFNSFLLTQYLKLPEVLRRMENIVSGGAIQRIVLKEFRKFKVLVPSENTQKNIGSHIEDLMKRTFFGSKEIELNKKLIGVILSKMTQVEPEKELA